jgi:hypothetical protein
MGSLKSETVKYGRDCQGTRTRERLRWEDTAAYTKDRSIIEASFIEAFESKKYVHNLKNKL